MGLRLWVDSTVLIPRPETELVVEKALEILASCGGAPPRVLDIGTGSGNNAIALAHRLRGCAVTAVDKSPAALELAARNLQRHGLDGQRFDDARAGGNDLAKIVQEGFERTDKKLGNLEKSVEEQIDGLAGTSQNSLFESEERLGGKIQKSSEWLQAEINKKVEKTDHNTLTYRVEKLEKKFA